MYFTSSLVNGGPLGSAFAGNLGDTAASSTTVKYVFQNPIEINGSYNFIPITKLIFCRFIFHVVFRLVIIMLHQFLRRVDDQVLY